MLCGKGPTGRAISIFSGFGSGIEKKSQVASRFGLGRSVEIFDRLFSVALFSLGFILICQVFPGISGNNDISGFPIPDYFQNLIRSGIGGNVG